MCELCTKISLLLMITSCVVKFILILCNVSSRLPPRTYELKVHGGSPFESGVELDPATSIKSTGGLIPSILRTNQTPRLYVRLLSIPRAKKALYDLLPPNIVTSSLYAQPLACFRHLVGVAFLRGRLGLPLESEIVCVCVHA